MVEGSKTASQQLHKDAQQDKEVMAKWFEHFFDNLDSVKEIEERERR